MKLKTTSTLKQSLLFVFFACLLFSSEQLFSQANSITSGASFTWDGPQPQPDRAADLESITVNGKTFNTFAVPSGYSLIQVGPAGDGDNRIYEDGTQILGTSADPTWASEALKAYQSLNLNYYFSSSNNGEAICSDYSAVPTTIGQIQSVTYAPALPVNDGAILAVTERNANNCQHISLYGTLPGSSTVQLLGQTFVTPAGSSSGPQPNLPPPPGGDYWLTERVNQNNGTIGIALYELTEFAPAGSTITEIRFTAATVDVADGKFLIMQEYAVDECIDIKLNRDGNGDVGLNDNVPAGSDYTLISGPSNGTLTFNSDGTYNYQPNAGYSGTDSFEYEVCLPPPNRNVCDTATVCIGIGPDAQADSAIVESNSSNNRINILTNDIFGSSGPQTGNAITNNTNPANGTVTLNNNGTPGNPLDDYFTYTPNGGFEGTDSFTYEITDAAGNTATATVIITVAPDTDNDNIPNPIDLDDDNDGILDSNESQECIDDDYIQWGLNSPIGGRSVDFVQNAAITNWLLASTGNIATGAGLNSSSPGSELQISSLDAYTYAEALANNEYIQVSFTTGSGISGQMIERLGVNWYQNSDGFTIGNSYDAAIAISSDNFATSHLLNTDVQIHYPSNGVSEFFDLLPTGTTYRLEENTTYTLRFYAYNQTNDGNVAYSVYDDFTIRFSGCQDLDTDGDGIANHLEGDSDNDGCADAIEAGHTDPDGDLVLGNSPESVTSDGLVTGQGGYTGVTGNETIATQVTLNTAPIDQMVNNGGSVSFSIDLTAINTTSFSSGTPNYTGPGSSDSSGQLQYQWQENGTNLSNGGVYSGVNTPTLTISNTSGLDNNTYTVLVTHLNNACFTLDRTATLSITPEITINDSSTVEGTNNVFTITSSAAISQDVIFNIGYTNISTTNADYSGPNTVTLSANSTSVSFNVAAADDSFIEATETFNANISYDSGGTVNIIDNQGLGEILDNDGGPGNGLFFDNTNVIVDEDAGTATFTVRLTGNVPGGFTVNYATSDDTALAVSDYSDTNGTLTFSGNDNEFFDIVVPITDDNIHELTQSFNLNLSGLSTTLITINDTTATGTINDDDNASVFAKFVAVFESDLVYNLEVELNAPVEHSFTVDFETFGDENVGLGGTATVGVDYAANVSTTFTFPSNSAAGAIVSIPITVIDDAIIEPTETIIQVVDNVSDPTIGILAPNRTFSIQDDDGGAGSGISVADFTVDESVGTANFVVSSNVAVAGAYTVNYTISNGSAVRNQDFTVPAMTGTLNFSGADGQTVNIPIDITDDAIIEGTENLTVTINSISNPLVNIVDGDATGTITDNDGGAGLGISVADFTVDESVGTANFVVSSNVAVAGAYTVNYTISNGSAVRNQDFTVPAMTGTLNFSGVSGQNVNIPIDITDDAIIEGTENLTVTINSVSNPLVNIVDGDATGTITDNDGGAGSGISVADFTVDESVGTANFVVSSNVAVAGAYTVNYTISNGSAVRNQDFTVPAMTGTLNFSGADGQTVNIPIDITDDAIIEGTENLTVTINSISNPLVNIVDGDATGTITDNDGGAGSGISVADFTVDESVGTANFVVSSNVAVAGAYTVNYTISNGSAVRNQDFTVPAMTGTLNFSGADGQTVNIPIDITDDAIIEGTENLTVTINSISNPLVNIVDGDATGTITDNDGGAGSGISVADFTVDESVGTANFVVSSNVAVAGAYTVNYTISNGSAVRNQDFTVPAMTGTLNFSGADGQTVNIPIDITDDAIIEGTENLTVTINSISNPLVNIVDGDATGTITDNDGGAGSGISVADFTVDESVGTANFVVSSNVAVAGAYTVNYTISNGSAVRNQDFTVPAMTGTLNFSGADGQTVNIPIDITDDAIIEGTENLTVTINSISNPLVNIVDGDATGTITDNDGGAGVGISVADFTVDESAGTATFDVSLNADVQGGFAVDFTVADGSAIAPGDYTVASNTGTLNFVGNNGEVQTVTVTIIDDTLIESAEDLGITLSGLSTGLINIVDGNATGTITDNDGGAGVGISVADFTVDESAGTATFDVSLNADVQGGFAVDFTVADGSAIAPGDYTVASNTGTLNFAGNNGEVQTVTVTIIDDTLIESAEDLGITLSGLSTGLINIVDGNATGTITDNDGGAGVGISVADFTVDESAGTATFDVSLNADVQGGFAVDFTVADGSAIAPGDYTVASNTGTLNFAGNNGEVQTVTVTIIDDTLIESAEDLGITLSGLSTGLINIVDGNATGTITDNDGGAGVGISVADFTVDESAGTATFDVSLNADVQGGFAVDFTVADGSAIAPGDYTVASNTGTLNFAGNNGEVQTVTVTIIDDTLIESAEDLGITLSGLSTGLINIVDGNATGTITDNDGGAGVGISVADFTVDESAGTATFDVSLNADVQGGFAVDFTVADGSAIAPGDYTVASNTGTLNFVGNNGEVQTVTVTIIDDTLIESAEDLGITLSGLSTGLINIVDGNATGTITDNDGGAGVGISVADFTVDESAGTATFDVSLNADVQGGFAVDFTVADGSAIAPGDYTVASNTGTLNFAGNNGEVQTVTVTIIDDTLIESAEDLGITLSGLSTGLINIVDGNATGTITDNDGGAGVGISVADFTVDESAGTATFDVSLNADVQGGFAVDFTVADGSAIAPGDYTVASNTGTLNFAGNNGEVQTVTVTIIDDTLIESAEDLGITLSGLSTGLINIVDGNATGTITDNDGGAGVGISVADFTVDESAGTATFDVSLNADVQGGFAVDFTVADGSAIAPGDYTVASNTGTLNFAGNNGEVQTVTVTIIDDTLIESAEDLGITLSGLSTGLINIVDGNATGTITDNDGGAGVGISVADFTVDESAGTATFDVSLNADVQGGFAVDFTVADGSAIAPGDYTVASNTGTLNFAGNNGEVQTVTVTIIDDTLIESAEDLGITLSGLSTGLINIVDGDATGTITDNDANGPTEGVAVADFTVNEDAGTATFVISYTGNTVQDAFNVNFNVTDNTAINPDDYTVANTNAFVTFPAGTVSGDTQLVTINIVDDMIIEATETLDITLAFDATPPAGINMLDDTGLGTITDNDANDPTEGIAVSDFTVNEDAGTATFVISYTGNTVQDAFNVNFNVTDNTAINPDDYTVANTDAFVTFPAGTVSGDTQLVTINIVDDMIIEATETLDITLAFDATPPAGINMLDDTGLGTITDNDANDPTEGIAVSDFTVNEDAGTATFVISYTGNTVQDAFNVNFNVTDNTAINPDDYTVANTDAFVTFPAGTVSGDTQLVTINIVDDMIIEATETLDITLAFDATPPAGINMLDDIGLGTITDNDANDPTEGIAVSDFTVNEDAGTATFVISYTGNTVQDAFNVNFNVTDNTAINPDDYTVANTDAFVTFPAGTVSGDTQLVTINIVDDMIIEATETLDITLAFDATPPAGINMLDDTGLGTITDNDANDPTEGVAVADFTVNEDAGTATFVISYTGNTVQDAFNVNFNVTDNTAINPDDYTVANTDAFVTFPAGTVSGDTQLVTINIVDDMIIEATETLDITLAFDATPPAGINMLDDIGLGTITDNDANGPTEGIAVSDFTVNEDAGTATFVISYTGNTVQDAFNVNFNVTDNTAINPDDYTVANTDAFVTFPAGTVSGDTQLVTINIVDDMIIEATETLDITLAFDATPPAGINMLDDTGLGTITDNDANDPTEGVAVADFTVNEDAGTATFVISYTGNTVQDAFNVNFNVTDNTAINPDDYTVANTDAFVTFPAGTVSGDTQLVTINIVDDMIIEATETLDITLAFDATPPAGINMLDDTGLGTITDNDANDPTEGIAVSDFTVNEDAGTATFVISYTGNTVQDAFNVNFNVTDNTAINPDDYTVVAVSGTLVFPAGTVSGDLQTITVNIIDDELSEMAETLDITLSFDVPPPAGINMLDGEGVGTILDNDITSSDYEEEVTILCGEELPEVPELTFMGGCGDYDVVFNEETEFSDDTDDYLVIRTWDVTDSCGNMESFQQIIFVMQPQLEEVFIDICVEDEPIDLINYLPEGFDTNGTFEIEREGTYLNNTSFVPFGLEIGEYKIMYSSTGGTCKYYVDFYITTNKDCVPCNRDEIKVSETVTVNGDGINDYFEIKGVEYCEFTFDVMIFNRWGDKVYEGKDYQNDWGGFAPNNSFGSSGLVPAGTYYYILSINGSDEPLEPINGYIYVGTE